MATEKRLIDANALVERLNKSHEYHARNSREEILLYRDIRIIGEQPTVDAVEVVRCEDCKHWSYISGLDKAPHCAVFCGLHSKAYETAPEHFCSYGERKPE